MGTYLFAYHDNPDADPNEQPTEAELANEVVAWRAWYTQLADALVDGGNPVGRTQTVLGDRSAADGGGSNPITGYTLVRAANLDEAVALAKGSPVVGHGGSVEVCEMLELM